MARYKVYKLYLLPGFLNRIGRFLPILCTVLVTVVVDVSTSSGTTTEPSSRPITDEDQTCFSSINNIQVFTSNDSSCGDIEPIRRELAEHRRELDHLNSKQDTAADSTSVPMRRKAIRHKDCLDVQRAGHTDNGPYALHNGWEAFRAYCDMTTDGGGWTLIHRREFGRVDFYRNWTEYRDGFGSVKHEHWLGNERIHRLLSQKRYELRIDLGDFAGETAYAAYSSMYLDGEEDGYRLWVGSYSGTAGTSDSLVHHNGHKFSTKDADNDISDSLHCAQYTHGAWWYTQCVDSNLNGRYYASSSADTNHLDGIRWDFWKNNQKPLRTAEMKIRPV